MARPWNKYFNADATSARRKASFFGGYRYAMSGRKWKRRKGHWPREQPPRSTTKQDLRKEAL